MAEMRVIVENDIQVAGGTIEVVNTEPMATYQTMNPNLVGAYSFSIGNVPGVAAANNFISLFNPLASGRTLSLGGAFISSTAMGGTSETNPMNGFRITAASAGTLQAASAVAKFVSSYPDAAAEVRTGNPTVTLGAQIFTSPPTISGTVGSTAVHQVAIPPNAGPFVLAPGEGAVLRTAVGDTDQRWNMTIVWVEI